MADFSTVRDLTLSPQLHDLSQPALPDLATSFDAWRSFDLTLTGDFAGQVYPAPHAPLPQVGNHGGPRLQSPRLTSVTFGGDALAPELETFLNGVIASSWWGPAVSDYGIGSGLVMPPVRLTEVPPQQIDDSEIQQWLIEKLNGQHPEFGRPDGNSLYLLYYPTSTLITYGTYQGCVDFGGYHSSVVLPAGLEVAYAVMARCADNPLDPALSVFETVTVVASHEIVEAASDAHPDSAPAFSDVDVDNRGWEGSTGTEVADLCSFLPGADYTFADFPFRVQRSWSNTAAKAGRDPCQPAPPGEVYFNAAPVLVDSISDPTGIDMFTKGILAAPGESKTIELDLYSEGPTLPITVRAVDLSARFGLPPTLDLTLDHDTGVNGDKLHLTVTSRPENISTSILSIESHLGPYTTQWLVMVSPD